MKTDGLRMRNAEPIEAWKSGIDIGRKVLEVGVKLNSADHTDVCMWLSAANAKKLIEMLQKQLDYPKKPKSS